MVFARVPFKLYLFAGDRFGSGPVPPEVRCFLCLRGHEEAVPRAEIATHEHEHEPKQYVHF